MSEGLVKSSARMPLEILGDGLCHIFLAHGKITPSNLLSSTDVAIKLERYLNERGWTIAQAAIAALNVPALIQAEREACAKVADDYFKCADRPTSYAAGERTAAGTIAVGIRARLP